MNLRGTSVLITGASRGFGRALAFELGRRGAKLALVARDAEALAAVVRELNAADVEAYAIPADVAGDGAATAIAARANAALGAIDVLVHNASDLGPVPLQLLLDTRTADFERAFAVNVTAPFLLSRAVVGPMVLRGRGLVVHVTSDASTNAYPKWGAYGASKAALDHLSRIWGAELADHGIKFVAFDPGEMDTKMHADAIPEADPATLAKPEDVAKRLAALIGENRR
jgi:NAD(P)-dependent dehydrogenase (short-subunit alcohol dehydrogenase family)